MPKALAVLAVALCAVLGLLLWGARDASAATDSTCPLATVTDVCDLPTTTVVPTDTVLPPISLCLPVNSDHTYCDRDGHRVGGVRDSHGCYRWQHWDSDADKCVRDSSDTTTVVTSPPSTTVIELPGRTQVIRRPRGGAETGDGLTLR